MTVYSKGEWTNCRYDICEILKNDELFCTVATDDADLIIRILNENEQLKQEVGYYKTLLQSLKEQAEKISQNKVMPN